jgi:uncharacterized protein YndB with AHSA1/START domain
MWTDPDELARWWGPEQFETPREKIVWDVREGGVARMTMVGPGGEEYPSDGRFRDVQPPSRLVFGEDETSHPTISSSETTVEIDDLGDGRTALRITSRMVCGPELPEMAKVGWSSQLDKLEQLLD